MTPKNKEVEFAFNEDNRRKKQIAQSARKRVGQRRGCDFLPRTPSELNAMNGPCTTYRLSEPMKWASFTQIPQRIQTEYLRSLAKRFHATEEMLPSLFGATPTAVRNYLSNKGLAGVMAASSGNQAPDVEGWKAFTNRLWHPDTTPVVTPVSVDPVDRRGLLAIPSAKDTANKEELSKCLQEMMDTYKDKAALAERLCVSRMLVARGLRKTLSPTSTQALLDKVRAMQSKETMFDADTWTKVSEVTIPAPNGVTISSDKEPDPTTVLSLSGTAKNVMETIKALLSRKDSEALVTVSIHMSAR